MRSIAVLGAGNIGKRHLQALVSLSFPARVYVVDPNADASSFLTNLNINPGVVSFEYRSSILELPSHLEVVVVATNSDVRLGVMRELLSHSSVAHLILEKFLFPVESDFFEAASLLKAASTQGWVNCPRRLWPFYSELKSRLKGSRWLSLSCSASNLGLGCNAIHYVDLAAFLFDEQERSLNDLSFDRSSLLPGVIDSKRPGFSEFVGTLVGGSSAGLELFIRSFQSGSSSGLLSIQSENLQCIVSEKDQWAKIASVEKSWQWEDIPAPVVFQSRLTGNVVSDLVCNGTCVLPTYSESAVYHLALLRTFQKHVGARGYKIT